MCLLSYVYICHTNASTGGPPLIVFARGAHGSLELLASPASAYDVIGLDWTMDPADVVARVGHT